MPADRIEELPLQKDRAVYCVESSGPDPPTRSQATLLVLADLKRPSIDRGERAGRKHTGYGRGHLHTTEQGAPRLPIWEAGIGPCRDRNDLCCLFLKPAYTILNCYQPMCCSVLLDHYLIPAGSIEGAIMSSFPHSHFASIRRVSRALPHRVPLSSSEKFLYFPTYNHQTSVVSSLSVMFDAVHF